MFILGDQQLRKYYANQGLLTLNAKTQDTLNKITVQLEYAKRHLNEYKKFINVTVSVFL